MSMYITLNGMFESVTSVLLVNCHLVCLIRDFGGKHTLQFLLLLLSVETQAEKNGWFKINFWRLYVMFKNYILGGLYLI